jgi:hypothetical protein
VRSTINLRLGTRLTKVLAIVASQIPEDSSRQWISHQDGCVEARYVSRTLAHMLDGDDTQGAVYVEAEDLPPSTTDPVANPTTFTDVSLSLGTAQASGVNPGPC